MPELRVFAPDDYAWGAAAEIAARVQAVAAERGRCRIALAGGGTPAPIYRALSREPLVDKVPWERVELYWGDERCVPPEDPASNYRLVRETLLDHLPGPPAAVHRIEGERPPEEAARAYEQVLGNEPLDVLLLGMGEDGHTASLFPADPGSAVDARRVRAESSAPDAFVIATTSPAPPRDRVSLSFRSINRGRWVYLLVTGASKAERLSEVYHQVERGTPELPAARVQPAQGRLVWLLDTDAASRLPHEATR